jgi:ELWxxDGT repeat protein
MLANLEQEGTVAAWPTEMTTIGTHVYFTADGGTPSGRRLWDLDLLTSNVSQVGEGFSQPFGLLNIDGTLYFSAQDTAHGRELWRSDGTTAGTSLVQDIQPGSGGSDPLNLTNVHGTLFFTAHDAIHGRELWRASQTSLGAELIGDLVPGLGGSSPWNLTNVDGVLYFAAWDSAHGNEPWWLPPVPGDTNADGRVDSLDLLTLLSHFGQPGTRAAGDIDGNRTIDSADLLLMLANYTLEEVVDRVFASEHD